MLQLFATGVVDTGDKFNAGVVDTGGNCHWHSDTSSIAGKFKGLVATASLVIYFIFFHTFIIKFILYMQSYQFADASFLFLH